jgi:hypothetical protein
MNIPSPTNRVQKILDKIKNHPFISQVVVVGVIIIAIGSFANALKDIGSLFPPLSTPMPIINDFSACSKPCNGMNSQSEFPEETTQVYLYWKYEYIPIGAHYVRTWSWEGHEWVKYDCTWKGPETGEDEVPPLTELGGFRSGRWIMTIYINDVVAFRSEPITIQGNNAYWKPVEDTIYNCYGNVP